MNRPAARAAAAALAAAAMLAAAPPAAAACGATGDICSGTTEVTFTVVALPPVGTIAIAPAPAALLTVADGVATGSLGATEVLDTRPASTGWTASIAATDFVVTGVADPGADGTIPASSATVHMAAPTAVLGSPTLTGWPTAAAPLTLAAAPAPLLSAAATGATTTAYVPQIAVTVPDGKTPGLYAGTVTQSVS